MEKQKSVKVNFIMNALLSLSSIFFPLISSPYAFRVLLPEGIGKVTFVNSVINYFTMFAMLGVPVYGIRACASVRDDKEKLSKTVQEILIINIVMGILSYIVLIFSILLSNKLYQYKTLFIVMSTAISLNVLGMEWLYKALEKYTYITIRSIVFKVLALILLFMFVKDESDVAIYGGITIFSSFGSYILNFKNVQKYVNLRPVYRLEVKKHFRFIAVFFAMNIATTVYTNLDTVMLSVMCGDAEVGYYTAAVKIKSVLVSIVTSLSVVLMPRVSYYITNKMYDLFDEVTKKALSFVFVIAIPVSVYFMLFAHQSIMLLSGEAFLQAVLPMKIIMPTVLLIGITNVLGIQILVPMNKENAVLLSEIVGALVDLVLNAILIPLYGASGAALGTLAAEVAVLIVQFIALKSYILPVIKKIQFVKMLIAVLVASVCGLSMVKWEGNNLYILVISACVFFGVYGIMLIIQKEKMCLELVVQLRHMCNRNK